MLNSGAIDEDGMAQPCRQSYTVPPVTIHIKHIILSAAQMSFPETLIIIG